MALQQQHFPMRDRYGKFRAARPAGKAPMTGRPYFVAVSMLNASRPRGLVIVLLLSLLLNGCRKDDRTSRWDVDVLAPLVTGRFTIRDLVADSLLEVDADGGVRLVYRSNLFDVGLDTLFAAPDTEFVYSYALPFPGPINFPPGLQLLDIADNSRFDLDGVELSRLDLREGLLRIRTRNMVQSALLGRFELGGATFPDGGNTINTTAGPGTPGSPAVTTFTRDLAGTRLDLRGPQFNSYNTLSSLISTQLDPAGTGATITDQDSIIITVDYLGLVPQYATGSFGRRVVQQQGQNLPLDLFRNIVGGTLDLEQVRLALKIENGVGMDLQLDLQRFTAVNSRSGASVDLAHAILNGPINLNRAIDLGTGPQPSFYSNELDQDDSNIDTFLEVLPDRIDYDVVLRVNPLGDISNGNDFLYYESRLKADLELEVPLRLIANALTLETLVQPDLPGSAEGHALQSGELIVLGTNGFPFDARLELALVDTTGAVLSTIPVSGSLQAGLLGPDGTVVQATNSDARAMVSPEQLDLLYQGRQLRLRAIFNTVGQGGYVRLLERYALDVRITARANYLVNGDE
jgi:hypothetical protein